MTYNPEKPQDGKKTPEQIERETREKLAEAKAKIDPNASASEMIKAFFRDYKARSSKENLQQLGAIVFALTIGKLLGTKPKEEEKEEANEEGSEEGAEAPAAPAAPPAEPGKKEDQAPAKPVAAAPPQPPIDTAKFRSGPDVVKSLTGHFSRVEIQRQGIPLKTAVAKDRPGAPGWTKESTDNWDWAKAGNTDENIKEGIYSIEGTLPPEGYTRGGTDSVPGETRTKLTAICMALLKDPRMPLFTGIAMKVDGVEVMLVKEIHLHPRGTASTYLCQPHTGVSYIMKKA